jgi:hypothetical protein
MARKLYLIPIIHMSADMGAVALALDKRATAELGQELWQKHQKVVSGFWDSINQFFGSLDVNGFKVYQDGLVANGAEGLRIVREGINQGSKNYQIIGKLLERGAVLVRTENLTLVKQERSHIMKMAACKSPKEREVTAFRYKLAQSRLLKRRDHFIASRIGETLGEGETGILFIGAYHNIMPNLPADIKVVRVKEVDKVRDYHTELINKRRWGRYLQELSEYLVSPVLAPNRS